MQNSRTAWIFHQLAALFVVGCFFFALAAQQPSADTPPPHRALIYEYCGSCHNESEKKAGLALTTLGALSVDEAPEVWEKVVRKLRGRQMPPLGMPRPDQYAYDVVIASLVASLDNAAAAEPNPGRTDTFRRLNRTEYQNAIRDLLALDVDVASLLPSDSSSHGFDNVTVGDLSPTLLTRYISAAQKISRLAVGGPGLSPGGSTIRIRPDITQEEHFDGLPLGTRGGALVPHTFPVDGEYEIQIRLARDRNEHIEGLTKTHEVELLLDRERVQLFTVTPPRRDAEFSLSYQPSHQNLDQHLKVRIPVKSGPHTLGVTFLKDPTELLESGRQPFDAHFNYHRHPRIQPALYQISITGPYTVTGRGDTPSRRRIFVCEPENPEENEGCAKRILSTLMRRAYRRPLTDADLQGPMEFYREGWASGGFEAGIEQALTAVLVNPEFLFRIEQDAAGVAPNTVYRITDLELASRLSFFLWSSIPDDELLDLAIRRELEKPRVLEQQVRRLLADSRSRSLVTNFATQWLHLRNLESSTPDMRLFPDFDDNLRQAFRRETELLFEGIMRENRSVLDLLRADHTFLNERLAKHYDIPHVYGSRFRSIALGKDSKRGGLLRHGSILTVTSYATRTSPVIRGKWILDNILGVPPPPPPADIPALQDNAVDGSLSVRDRLAEHRDNPACASCHNLMDPVGFSLEHFDAVGRWRSVEQGVLIDASGGLPDGSKFADVSGLEQALLRRPEMLVGTLSEKLLTFAIGRGVEAYDAPAIRQIVRDAGSDGYRFSSLILGVVKSAPFQMRTSR